MLPLAFLCAIAFCPINDMAVTLSRRFGAGFVSSAGKKSAAGWRDRTILRP